MMLYIYGIATAVLIGIVMTSVCLEIRERNRLRRAMESWDKRNEEWNKRV